jgi:hypothetical protein
MAILTVVIVHGPVMIAVAAVPNGPIENVAAIIARVGAERFKVPIGNFEISCTDLPRYLAALLRRVVFIGEPALGAGYSIRGRCVDGEGLFIAEVPNADDRRTLRLLPCGCRARRSCPRR